MSIDLNLTPENTPDQVQELIKYGEESLSGDVRSFIEEVLKLVPREDSSVPEPHVTTSQVGTVYAY